MVRRHPHRAGPACASLPTLLAHVDAEAANPPSEGFR